MLHTFLYFHERRLKNMVNVILRNRWLNVRTNINNLFKCYIAGQYLYLLMDNKVAQKVVSFQIIC